MLRIDTDQYQKLLQQLQIDKANKAALEEKLLSNNPADQWGAKRAINTATILSLPKRLIVALGKKG